jgi:hypothetical protein
MLIWVINILVFTMINFDWCFKLLKFVILMCDDVYTKQKHYCFHIMFINIYTLMNNSIT